MADFRRWILALALFALVGNLAFAGVPAVNTGPPAQTVVVAMTLNPGSGATLTSDSPPPANLTTSSLFPYMTEVAGFDTSITIADLSACGCAQEVATRPEKVHLVVVISIDLAEQVNAEPAGNANLQNIAMNNTADQRAITASGNTANQNNVTFTNAAAIANAGNTAANLRLTPVPPGANSNVAVQNTGDASPPEVVYLGNNLAGTRIGNVTG